MSNRIALDHQRDLAETLQHGCGLRRRFCYDLRDLIIPNGIDRAIGRSCLPVPGSAFKFLYVFRLAPNAHPIRVRPGDAKLHEIARIMRQIFAEMNVRRQHRSRVERWNAGIHDHDGMKLVLRYQ